MAEETAAKQSTVPNSEEQEMAVVVTDVAEVEHNTTLKAPPTDDDAAESAPNGTTETKVVVVAHEAIDDELTSVVKPAAAVDNHASEITSDDDNVFPENEKKALAELKKLIQNALNNHEFSSVPVAAAVAAVVAEEGPSQAETDIEKTVEEEVREETTNDGLQEAAKISVDEDGTKTVEAIEETVVVNLTAASADQQRTLESIKESSADTAGAGTSPVAVVSQQEVTTIPEAKEGASLLPPEEVSIWGVPLFKDERTDTVLWKFLRARDFKVNDAFAMFKSTIKWRKEFKVDELLEEDLGEDLEKMVFMHGFSKEGHPVCYNVYGAFQDKGLYQKTFSDEEKREKFMKWRIQFLEKSIRKLDFYPGGISTILQINDLKNSPGPGKWELRQATKQALHLLQDNYPEFVAKQVFINVPWWYVAVNKMITPFLTQRTKSKFVVAGPSKSAETLLSYIAPEQIPVKYGGFSKEGEFGTKDGATQIFVKPNSKETVEFAVTEACHLTWEVRVLGWEVSYGAEFVPNAKDAYTVIIQKMRKVGPTEETILNNSFKTSESGRVVLTIHNSSSKKKRLLYRLKSHPTFD